MTHLTSTANMTANAFSRHSNTHSSPSTYQKNQIRSYSLALVQKISISSNIGHISPHIHLFVLRIPPIIQINQHNSRLNAVRAPTALGANHTDPPQAWVSSAASFIKSNLSFKQFQTPRTIHSQKSGYHHVLSRIRTRINKTAHQ